MYKRFVFLFTLIVFSFIQSFAVNVNLLRNGVEVVYIGELGKDLCKEGKFPFLSRKIRKTDALHISFEVKPYDFDNQVWVGAFCGPDGRGGIGLLIWNGNIYFKVGNSCKDRYPSEYIEWKIPLSTIKLNQWNKVEIVYEPKKFLSIRINSFYKELTHKVPSIVSTRFYFGTDPRHPGINYNFCGAIKNFIIRYGFYGILEF